VAAVVSFGKRGSRKGFDSYPKGFERRPRAHRGGGMRLIRFGEFGRERPGLIGNAGECIDMSEYFDDWNGKFFARNGLSELEELVAHSRRRFNTIADHIRWGAPIGRPGKIVCAGLNYFDHAMESGAPTPSEPVLFMKAPNSVVVTF
jgi:2,4-didehydro-3-deoxy-L-rhamnonate hydrolase